MITSKTTSYLNDFLSEFAKGIKIADSRRPQKISRTGRVYQEGIGPFTEDETVDLVLKEFSSDWNNCKMDRFVSFPSLPRSKCDLCLTTPAGKVFIEIKMMRLFGDNGKTNDNITTHILSPYSQQRSAVTDIRKLHNSGFNGDKAIMIYGYDYDDYPVSLMMDCFEALGGTWLRLPRLLHKFDELNHPVHTRGEVYGWMLS